MIEYFNKFDLILLLMTEKSSLSVNVGKSIKEIFNTLHEEANNQFSVSCNFIKIPNQKILI